MAITATVFQAPPPDRRGANRRAIDRDSTIRDLTDGEPHPALVHDLSCDGLRLETSLDLAIGSEVSIGLPGVGTRTVRVIRRDEGLYGCSFETPVPPALLSQAFAASPVVKASFTRPLPAELPEPYVRKWHPAIRLALILGLGLVAWAAIARLLAG